MINICDLGEASLELLLMIRWDFFATAIGWQWLLVFFVRIILGLISVILLLYAMNLEKLVSIQATCINLKESMTINEILY